MVRRIMKDHPLFTIEEIREIANRWYFWKGLLYGAMGMLIGLTVLGLYLNY
jgi:hypothetical protein